MAFQPWIRETARLLNAEGMTFNGAMAFQPWIRGARWRSVCPACATSFNGAMAFQPWILANADGVSGRRICLQWSHGLSAMDTRLV